MSNGSKCSVTDRCGNCMPRYFMGVMDIEVRTGTIGNMKLVDEYRLFNDKFVDSPELALLVAFDEGGDRWKGKMDKIFKDVTYDPVTKEWKRTFLETTNGHTPTEKQRKKFERGEYVFNQITEYVQVMETKLCGSNTMMDNACAEWRERMETIHEK